MEPDNRVRCPSCGEHKRAEDFVRNRATKTGRGAYCKPCHNRIGRANREKHHGSTRAFWLKRRYGVEAVQVEWMILRQGGLCAVCGKRPAVHVDHDHGTGLVRGILCFNCNRGLGKLREDPGLMRAAIDYLEGTI
ncbi:MAG: endonuclease VII domain-containing protein [Actinomycetota bacterium]